MRIGPFSSIVWPASRILAVATAADAGFRRGGGGGGGGGHACGRDPKHSQLGGMGERCKLPHRGLGQSPRSQRFLRFKTFQNYVKIMII